MKFQLLAPALAGVFLLSACGTPADQRIAARVAAIPEAKRSYVIGAYAVGCQRDKNKCTQNYNSVSTSFRNVDDNDLQFGFQIVAGRMFADDTVPDYTRLDRRDNGVYFCIAVPAGRYSVYSYEFYNFANGGTRYSLSKDQQFDVPFSVAAGEVAYLGTLKISSATGRNLFGMNVAAPGVLMLSSLPDDGIPKALQKCPAEVRNRPVRNAALRADGSSPLVIADPKP